MKPSLHFALMVVILIHETFSLKWTHYIYFKWENPRQQWPRFNTTTLKHWRQASWAPHLAYSYHGQYIDSYRKMIEKNSYPCSVDTSDDRERTREFNVLERWAVSFIKFEPEASIRNEMNILHSDVLHELIARQEPFKVNITRRSSFMLLDGSGHVSPNKFIQEYKEDLRELEKLSIQLLATNLSDAEKIPQRILHNLQVYQSIIMRMLASTYYNKWFSEMTPSYDEVLAKLHIGFLPLVLVPSDSLTDALCAISNLIEEDYFFAVDCDEWLYYYTNRLASVAYTDTHMIVKLEIPVLKVEPHGLVTANKTNQVVVTPLRRVARLADIIVGVAISIYKALFKVFWLFLVLSYVVSLVREPAWQHLLALGLSYWPYAVDASEIAMLSDIIAHESLYYYIDLASELIIGIVLVLMLCTGYGRATRHLAFNGKEIHRVPYHGKISHYKLIIEFFLRTNTMLASYSQEITIGTRLSYYDIPMLTKSVRLMKSTHQWSVIFRNGRPYFELLTPMRLECIDSRRRVIQKMQYPIEFPLGDIRWDGLTPPFGFRSNYLHGECKLLLVKKPKPRITTVVEYPIDEMRALPSPPGCSHYDMSVVEEEPYKAGPSNKALYENNLDRTYQETKL